jgi:dolichyl-phosphate beta-glucosyltransferase
MFHRAKMAHAHLGLAFKVLRLPHRGKGAAVRAGMEAASGDPIVFLDADLTIPVEIIDLFLGALDTGADIAIASRYVAGSIVDRPWWRRVMGDVFRAIVHLLVPTSIRDTQCGGKMYTAEAAKDLFAKQRLNGFAFDAEVLFLARRAGYTVREIPFALRQHGETRIDFLADTPKMLRDLFVIRLNELRGRYGE